MGYDGSEPLLTLENRSAEPHAPLVSEPRDAKGVADRKQNAGVEARRRTNARAG